MWDGLKFGSDTSGNVSMMFAVGAVMLLGGIGVAVDYSNITRAEKVLQSQVDAAVLAGATVSLVGIDDEEGAELNARRDAALNVISSNGFDTEANPPTITMTATTFQIRAEIEYTPVFGGMIGRDKVLISAETESGLGEIKPVEIALVLDNTYSMMQDGKMAALKTGANNLIEAVERSGSGSKIALVPFARYVRIQDKYLSPSWFEHPVEFDTTITWQQATHSGGTCVEEQRTRIRDGVSEDYTSNVCTGQTTTYEEKTRVEESRYKDCIGTRPPPYNEQDGNYGIKIPGLLEKIPYQHTGLSNDIWAPCPNPVRPLSNNYAELKEHILALKGTDQTYIPSGLIWGQRVLSPGEPFDNSETPEGAQKIMVLMTDGRNSAEITTDQASVDEYRAPPYIGTAQAEEQYAPLANAATARMCNKVKADGIEIHTIAFRIDDPATKTMLRNCATEPSFAYNADSNVGLVSTFEKISRSLEEAVRLMR